jgi:hypothetical protein
VTGEKLKILMQFYSLRCALRVIVDNGLDGSVNASCEGSFFPEFELIVSFPLPVVAVDAGR